MNKKLLIVAQTEGFSKTRNAMEDLRIEFRDTHALVDSASGKQYVVTRTSCTCYDHFFRNGVCRHMNAVNNAVQAVKYW